MVVATLVMRKVRVMEMICLTKLLNYSVYCVSTVFSLGSWRDLFFCGGSGLFDAVSFAAGVAGFFAVAFGLVF